MTSLYNSIYQIMVNNKYTNKILIWIEDNILDRIYSKRIYNKLIQSINSGFVPL